MVYPWEGTSSASTSASTASSLDIGIGEQDTELQDNPRTRFSTETQRANGYRQSNLPNRGDRIIEDLKNRNLTCSICIENIVIGNERGDGLWNCNKCHNVWHFQCVKVWSGANGSSIFTSAKWRCPECSEEHAGIAEPHCWCGKHKHSSGINGGNTPNSCASECGHKGKCIHNNVIKCQKFCHPGPCSFTCPSTCAHIPAPVVKPPGPWKRAWARLEHRKKGTISTFTWSLCMLISIWGLLGVLLFWHIRWKIMPYRYPGFNGWEEVYFMLLLLGGIVVMLLLGILIATCAGTFLNLLEHLFGLVNANGMPSNGGGKKAARFFLWVFLFPVFFALWVWPVVAFAGSANIAWYDAMKTSCTGLNTRITMDSISDLKFTIRSLTPGINSADFYLGPALETRPGDPDRSFTYYHRLSGRFLNGTFGAIDVDTENLLWRTIQLSRNDDENQWLSWESKQSGTKKNVADIYRPHTPITTGLRGRILNTGSFTKVNAHDKHMFFPDLGLAVSHMYGFLNNYYLEPFLRVFNTRMLEANGKQTNFVDGKSTAVKDALESTWNAERDWSLKAQTRPEIEMRTASFGHGRWNGMLTMCAREEGAKGGNGSGEGEGEGIREDLMVAFAVIAALRQRIYEMDIRWF